MEENKVTQCMESFSSSTSPKSALSIGGTFRSFIMNGKARMDFKQWDGTSYKKMLTEAPNNSRGSALAVRPKHWPNIKDSKLLDGKMYKKMLSATPSTKDGSVLAVQTKQWPNLKDFELWTGTTCNNKPTEPPKIGFQNNPVVIVLHLPDIQQPLRALETSINCPSQFDSAPWTGLCSTFMLLGYLEHLIHFPSDFDCAPSTSQGHKCTPLMFQGSEQWCESINKEILTRVPKLSGDNVLTVQPRLWPNIKLFNDEKANAKKRKVTRTILIITVYLKQIHPVSETGNAEQAVLPHISRFPNVTF